MSFKVLLILLSFATLATISHCHQVCLCCDEEIVAQDTTNCTSVGTLILDTEAKALLDYCKLVQTTSIHRDRNFYLAYIKQQTWDRFRFPRYSCTEIFNSFEGLIYRVPVSVLRELNKSHREVSYIGVQRETERNAKVIKETLGVVSEKGFEPFVSIERNYDVDVVEIKKYVYVIRFPIFYKVTYVDVRDDVKFLAKYNSAPRRSERAGFTLCNDKDGHVGLKLSLIERVTTTMRFNNYDFFPEANSKLGIYSSGTRTQSMIEVTDIEQRNMIGYMVDDNIVEYVTENEYLIGTNITVPPHLCISGDIIIIKKRTNQRFTADVELDFGTIGHDNDTLVVTKTGVKSALTIEQLYLDEVYTHHRGFITIPYNNIWFQLALGIVVGMAAFCLLLLIVIKTISCFEKMTFGSDWTAERYQAAALITEEKAATVRDRLARFGSYICNVGTWIYQEIK